MSELPPPPLIGPHAPANMTKRHRGDHNPYQGGEGPVISGRVGKGHRGALPKATPAVPIKSDEAIAIDQESKAIARDSAVLDVEGRAIEQLKKKDPKDQQVLARQRELKHKRTIIGQRGINLGKRKAALKAASAKNGQYTSSRQHEETAAGLGQLNLGDQQGSPYAQLQPGNANVQMQPQNLQMYAPTLVQPGHVYNQFQQQNKPIRITDFRNAQQNMQIHSPIPGQAGSAHGQTSYGQQIYAPAPAQFGNGYVQTQAPDHATFHTTTFGQVLQNQQVPAAAPVYYSGLQPLNAPKNFMIPSELDSWQQQQKVDEFALQQPKQDIASYGQEKNAAHQEQKSKGQGADFQHFQAYGKKFTDPSEVTAWQQQEVAEKIGSQGHNQGVTPHQQKEIEAALQRRKDSEIALQRQRENEAIRRQNKQKEKEKERENEKEASIQQQRPTRAAASFQQTKQKSDPSNSEVLDYHLSARYSLGPYVGVGFLSPTLTQDHSSILTPEKLQERDTRRAKLHKILFTPIASIPIIDLTEDEPSVEMVGAKDFLQESSTQVAKEALAMVEAMDAAREILPLSMMKTFSSSNPNR